MYLDSLSNNYAKMCFAAYVGDYDNFIKYFNKDNLVEMIAEMDCPDDWYWDEYPDKTNEEIEEIFKKDNYEDCTFGRLNNLHLLTYILCYSCRHNFIFAYQLRHSNMELNDAIRQSISARFISSNYLDDDFIVNYPVFCIWYPDHPSKDTCLKLLDKHKDYHRSVVYLSVIKGWKDLFNKCSLEGVSLHTIYTLCLFYKRDYINGNYQNEIYLIRDFYHDHLLYINISWDSKLNDDIFIKKIVNPFFNNFTANVSEVINLHLNYKIFSNNIKINRYNIDLKISNKYIAYIGDVRYYQLGDFEYAKYGALNNSLFANMVLNNQDKFPDYVCKNAVSNMLINAYINKDLVNKYKPFYLYNFTYIQESCAESILKDFPFLKYNVIYSLVNDRYYEFNETILPDIDIIKVMLSFNKFSSISNSLINKAKELGYFYQHLDFENEVNFIEPKKIPFDSVTFEISSSSIFKEGLDVTNCFSPVN